MGVDSVFVFFLLGCFRDTVLRSCSDLNEIQPGVRGVMPPPHTHTRVCTHPRNSVQSFCCSKQRFWKWPAASGSLGIIARGWSETAKERQLLSAGFGSLYRARSSRGCLLEVCKPALENCTMCVRESRS